MYVKEIKIIKVLPCLADVNKIRFHAELDKDISDLMPYLNRIIDGAIYNHQGHTLTIKKDGLITLHPKEIAAGQVKDVQTANKICDWIKQQINFIYENKDKIEPLYERRSQLNVLEIYKLLPQTNCKQCGEQTCIAFACKVLSEEKSIMLCKQIFEPQYEEKRRMLFKLLKDCGYKIPEVFV
jgi:ArsR family metal-binding transcriptional regulator